MSSRDHPDWWRPTGGQNSQDSVLERRSLIWNDNDVLDGVDPPAFYTCATFKGKFYPRGCRGMIEEILIYCRDAGADRLTLRYSPHPCMGPFNEVTITPLAGWSWVAAVIQEMWDYDSLFIWVYECEAGTDWAYDTERPYDGHESADTGATWADMAIRPFIRVVYTGETPGDVPVSGIINNIEIPGSAGEVTTAQVNVPHLTVTEICRFDGAGEMLQAHLIFQDETLPSAAVFYSLYIQCDGGALMYWENRQITQAVAAAFGRCSCGEFMQFMSRSRLYVRLPIKFKRQIILYALQSTGAGVVTDGYIYANVLS